MLTDACMFIDVRMRAYGYAYRYALRKHINYVGFYFMNACIYQLIRYNGIETGSPKGNERSPEISPL